MKRFFETGGLVFCLGLGIVAGYWMFFGEREQKPKPAKKTIDIGDATERGAEHVGRGGARGIVKGLRDELKKSKKD